MSNPSIFQSIAVKKPNRSFFDLSHSHKTTCDMGKLIPVMVHDVVPGDRVSVAQSALIRMAPMLAPIMHRVKVCFHSFFVPNRILWSHFEQFMTKTPQTLYDLSPGDPWVMPSFSLPEINSRFVGGLPLFYTGESSLFDYMGCPPVTSTGPSSPTRISAMPFMAVQRIFEDYYRWKGDLTGSGPTGAGDDSLASYMASSAYYDENLAENASLLDDWYRGLLSIDVRGWEHDYFTSALTATQKGDIVDIPLGSVAVNPDRGGDIPKWVQYADLDPAPPAQIPTPVDPFPDSSTIYRPFVTTKAIASSPGATTRVITGNDGANFTTASDELLYDPGDSLTVAPITVNELRRAEHLQEFLEILARGGSRYTEFVKNIFNVDTGDARVNRPEYIGGSVTPISISEVLNTTGATGGLVQGNMAGHGAAAVSRARDTYFVREHGWVITLMSIMPETGYMNGIPKMFTKFDPEEFFTPQFEGLGEQAILGKELFCDLNTDNSISDEEPWGYLPRHSEYKYINNRTSGAFRSSLNYWHLDRILQSKPPLNQSFVMASIGDQNLSNRIFAVTSGNNNKLWCYIHNDLKIARPMRKYTIPTLA